MGVFELRRTGGAAAGNVLDIDDAVLETEIGDEEEQMRMVRATSGVGGAAAPPVPLRRVRDLPGHGGGAAGPAAGGLAPFGSQLGAGSGGRRQANSGGPALAAAANSGGPALAAAARLPTSKLPTLDEYTGGAIPPKSWQQPRRRR